MLKTIQENNGTKIADLAEKIFKIAVVVVPTVWRIWVMSKQTKLEQKVEATTQVANSAVQKPTE